MSHKVGFEAETGYKVTRVLEQGGVEYYFTETLIGGHDERGYWEVVPEEGVPWTRTFD